VIQTLSDFGLQNSASAWSGDGSTGIIRLALPHRYTQPRNASPQGDDEYIKEQTP
jgi:hypothetical protein